MKKIKAILACAVALMLVGCTATDTEHIDSSQPEISSSSGSEESSQSEFSSASGSSSTVDSVPEKESENSEPKYVEFFKEKKVHELNIEISSADWYAMRSDPYSKTPRRVNITIDGTTIADAGIHPRGQQQLGLAIKYNSRLPYKIKFDEFVDGGNFLGLDEIALDNSATDPSIIRQLVGMETMRAVDIDAPYVTFFNVYINGKLHGFYAGIEAVDSSYLERVFGSHKHSLYKAGMYSSLAPSMYLSSLEQKKGSDESKTDLKRLIDVLDKTPLGEKGEIEDIIDVDSVLKLLAADAVMHNWDSYAGINAHNYYLYMSGGKFRIIPWDMNKTYQQTISELPSNGSSQDILSPIMGWVSEKSRPLVQKLMAVDEYYAKYIEYCEQCTKWLEEFYRNELPAYKDFVGVHYEKDPTRFYKTSTFYKEFDETNRDGITGFIKARIEYLNKRIPEIRAEKGLDKTEDE